MLKPLARFITLAFFLALTSSAIRANPIIITSGSLSVTGFAGIPSYSFSGANFSATAVGADFGNTGPASCFPCVSGNVISTNSTFAGSTLGHGTVTINGTTFSNVFIFGSLMFTGPSITMPVTGLANFTLTTPFTLSGSLGGCFGSQLSCDTVVFSTDVSGSGLASIQFQAFIDLQGQTLFQFQSITYTFNNTTVPEPASILFLTSGVAALAASKLRLRARARKKRQT